MPIIQKIDRGKFIQHAPIYKGSGVPFKPLNNKEIYLSKGGMIDLSQIVGVISNNKDLITSGVNAVGNVANAVKSISDTVKKAKELEEARHLKEAKHLKEKKKQEYVLSEAQQEALAKIGSGFAKF